MPGKFEIPHLVFLRQQAAAQRTGVIHKILLKTFFSRADVREELTFPVVQTHNGPFIEHDFFIARVHLVGAVFDKTFCLFNSHARNSHGRAGEQFQGQNAF